MRKWEGKLNSVIEAQARELQGKTNTKDVSSRKKASLVSSGQLSRPGRQFDLVSDPPKGTSKSFLQEVNSKFSGKD